ncbi:MAG TPA: serine/threonine-protein kinase [Planctomycetota bacterium]|jgi:serine/threonine protein kinase
MDSSDSERDPVDLVAEEFAAHYRRGENPSINDYARRYPDLAAQLLEVLPSVAMMEELKRRKHESSGSPPPGDTDIKQLGDYHVVREIGRGGMGIVYEAEQKTLGRHVALKVLPKHSLLDSKRLQRFQREAQAAGQLHHTNIVPVYGIGEAEGLHYIAMQYIRGQGLNDVLAGFRKKDAKATDASSTKALGLSLSAPGPASGPGHLEPSGRTQEPRAKSPNPTTLPFPPSGKSTDSAYWRWVAQIGVQVAEAIDYAHNQGILHRDIKPANIILDTQGIAWVTDFGLAKLSEQTDLTAPGDIVGTLQYMSPEALLSQADSRSDVCSLGLTLYEMLTLCPPFEAPSPAALMRMISEHDPARPRQINASIPRDLETIILKAIARQPEQRYQHARDLADDLRRFLDDAPIQARQAGSAERAWRWCRRNRAVAGLLVAVAASLLLALVVGWIGYLRTTEALARESQRRQDADAATQRAEAATRRAEANTALSLKALQEMLSEVDAPDEVFQAGPGPGGRPERPDPNRRMESREKAALLQSILKFYDRLAAENATNNTLKWEAAKAHYRIGDIQQRMNEYDKALSAYQRSLEMASALQKEAPAKADYAALVSDIHGRIGLALRKKGKPKDAEDHHRQALALLEALPGAKTNGSPYRLSISMARSALGQCLFEQKRPAEARKALEDAIAEARACMRDGPRPRVAMALRNDYKCLADIYTSIGEKTLAEAALRKAEEVLGGPMGNRPPPEADRWDPERWMPDPNRPPPPLDPNGQRPPPGRT